MHFCSEVTMLPASFEANTKGKLAGNSHRKMLATNHLCTVKIEILA